jgi:branched-chain amino acid transport system substrate-binding protein
MRFSVPGPFSTPRRGAILLLPALLLAALAVGCGSKATNKDDISNQPPRTDALSKIVVPAGRPLIVGISEPMTGSESAAGIEERDSALTSLMRWKAKNGSQIVGHDIQVRVEDDGCTDGNIAVQAAERLLRTPGLVGVLGPSCSAGAKKSIPTYEKGGIVAISGSATESDLTTGQPSGDFFFRTSYRSELQGLIGGQFVAQTLQAKTAYLIDDGESYGQDLVEDARAEMQALGVSVTRESISRGTVDFSALAKKIAAANPDFVGFGGYNPEAVLLYRQLRDAGYKGPFGAGDAAATISTFVEPVGAQAEGVYFVGCPLALPDDFLKDFESVHGGAPVASAFVAQYADAATILLDAVSQVAQQQPDGSLTIDPTALRNAVSRTRLVGGVSGNVAFDSVGDRASAGGDLTQQAKDLGLAACQVQNGKLVNLFP